MPDQSELYQHIQKVKDAYQDSLLKKANVVGVGIGFAHRNQQQTDQIALVVMVSQKQPKESLAPEDIIPAEIEGVQVDVQETGTLYAHR